MYLPKIWHYFTDLSKESKNLKKLSIIFYKNANLAIIRILLKLGGYKDGFICIRKNSTLDAPDHTVDELIHITFPVDKTRIHNLQKAYDNVQFPKLSVENDLLIVV